MVTVSSIELHTNLCWLCNTCSIRASWWYKQQWCDQNNDFYFITKNARTRAVEAEHKLAKSKSRVWTSSAQLLCHWSRWGAPICPAGRDRIAACSGPYEGIQAMTQTNKPNHNIDANNIFAEVWWIQFCSYNKKIGTGRQTDTGR